MTTRIETHRIDTKAVRTIFSHLDENWIVRSLDERDYGIDLQLERFDLDDATGDFIFVQVKGTEKQFNKSVRLSGFPVDTIEYALMFDVPFFVFHTSISSKKTRYVWLQNYVETLLEIKTPNWRSKKTVTIYFPEDNDLETNDAKITAIIKRDKFRKVGVKFLARYEWLKMHSDFVLYGQYAVANSCIDEVNRINKLSLFIEEYTIIKDGLDEYKSINDVYKNIAETKNITNSERNHIENALKFLDGVKFTFLNQFDTDEFLVEQGWDDPF